MEDRTSSPECTKYEEFFNEFLPKDNDTPLVSVESAVHRVDAISKASGELKYVADIKFPGMIYARMIRAEIPRGIIKKIHVPSLPKGYYFITEKDIPEGGKNCLNMITSDWKCFAAGVVRFRGETIGLLCGPNREKLLDLEKQIKIEYIEETPAVTIQEGLDCKGGAFVNDNNIHCHLKLEMGENVDDIFEKAPHVFEDTVETGFQEHVYLETNGIIIRKEGEKYVLYASSQCPFYIRKSIYTLLNIPIEDVVVRQISIGGAFGGKEHFPDILAGPLLVAEHKIGKPIKLIFQREEDIEYSVKRHPSLIKFKTATDENGNILAMDSKVYYNVGGYLASSYVVLQRGCFHIMGCYKFPSARTEGFGVATNCYPSCAFRGFGAPQAIFAIETHMCHLAKHFGIEPLEYKRKYLIKQGDTTITNGKIVEEVQCPKMIEQLTEASDYYTKSKEYGYGSYKGIGISFYNHGGAFTGNGESAIIKGRVRLTKNSNGTVDIFCGQTEMGQGINTALRKIAAVTLGLPMSKVNFNAPDTGVVPDSGPTAASRSTMVPGFLVEKAAKEMKERWDNEESFSVEKQYEHPEGYPWDQSTFQGYAYLGYGWGCSIVEVEIDKRTTEVQIKGIWSSHDVGNCIDKRIVYGQVNGGIAQGIGWASTELLQNIGGKFKETSFSDYIVPTSMDLPEQKVFFANSPYEWGPYGAKGMGELVFNGVGAAYIDAVSRAINRDISKIPVPSEYVTDHVLHGVSDCLKEIK